MRKILLSFILLLNIIAISAESNCHSYSASLDGTWDKWKACNWSFSIVHGNEFRFYGANDNPRDYFFTIRYNGTDPTKDEIKKHHKNQEWYEYTGTLTYFIDDDFPTAYSVLEKYSWLATKKLHKQNRPILTKQVQCRILLSPDTFYKKSRSWTINVFFNDSGKQVAFGISVNGYLISYNE